MNKVKPRHPRSLIAEPSVQGSKRKATESEDEGLGQAPDPSRSSQPNAEKEDKKQRVLDGRRAALGFLDGVNGEVHGRYGDLQEVREPGPRRIEEAAGTEKAMKMLRELLSSDPVSSEDIGGCGGAVLTNVQGKKERGASRERNKRDVQLHH